MKKLAKGIDIRQLITLLLIMVPVILLWDTVAMFPLRMLVVFFHELSHGLASVATGGRMISIALSHQEGGVCSTLGGNTFLILTAGYLGSMAWGGLILVAAARTRYDKAITSAIGIITAAVAVLYVRPLISFGFAFCALAGVAFILLGRFLPERFNDYLLKIIGLTSCLYAAADIVSDGISRNIPGSDANALGQLTHLPGALWSAVWLAVSVAASIYFLSIAAKKDNPPQEGRRDKVSAKR